MSPSIYIGAIAVSIGVAGGWKVRDWQADAQIAAIEAAYIAKAKAMADAVDRIEAEADAAIEQADKAGIEGIKDAEAETERVRRCIAAGTCGVWVKSTQPSVKLDLPKDASPGSLGNAASGLTPEAAGRVLDLWDAVDADAAKLEYLQEYARQCQRLGLEANSVTK